MTKLMEIAGRASGSLKADLDITILLYALC